MTYQINEIFQSIQGEGKFSGQLVTFIRLQGCNLRCAFCDTKKAWSKINNPMNHEEIVEEVNRLSNYCPYVVITGGEPLIWDLEPLIDELKNNYYLVHLETNGTIACKYWRKFDYITISPKENQPINLRIQNTDMFSYKYIVTEGLKYEDISKLANVYLQPRNNEPEMIKKAIKLIKRYPLWKLSIQIQKVINIR